ncbi:S-adenosyl-L-methionine-dependent methyltransferase [Haematococcus lacustris]
MRSGYTPTVRALLRLPPGRCSGPRALTTPRATSDEDAARSRRQLIGVSGLLAASLACGCAACSARASGSQRGGWYDSYFAWAMASVMQQYEVAIEPVKTTLFTSLVDKVVAQQEGQGPGPIRILEVGVGAAPNLRYLLAASEGRQQQQAASLDVDEPRSASMPSSSLAQASPALMQAASPSAHSPLQWELVGVDPNPAMQQYARKTADAVGFPQKQLRLEVASAEQLPFADASFDAAVMTLVLCSVPSPERAVAEVQRVLKPGGSLLTIEHVAASWDVEPWVRVQQTLLSPLQQAVADGCHLTRETGQLLRQGGWGGLELEEGKVPGLGALLENHVWGLATKA